MNCKTINICTTLRFIIYSHLIPGVRHHGTAEECENFRRLPDSHSALLFPLLYNRSFFFANGSNLPPSVPPGFGLNCVSLQGISVPAVSPEFVCIKGSIMIDKSAFVEGSQHWVPNTVPKADSLLDKLFYWIY
jgi:hypothetical protein